MGTEHSQQKQHIVLFPFLGQGHIIPFLQLADLIHRRRSPSTTTVTLVSTPLNILHLRRTLPCTTPLHLAELPFSSSDHDGLPPGVDNTRSLPLRLFSPLFLATQSLRPSFKTLLLDMLKGKEDNVVVRVVADIFLGWTVEVAREVGVSHSVFVTFGAYGMAVYSDLWLHHRTVRRECFNKDSLPDDEMMALPDFPEERLYRSLVAGAVYPGNGTEPMSVFLHRQISLCFASDGILVNTAKEMERKGLSMLRRMAARVPVWPVGPLLRPPSTTNRHQPDVAKRCIEWLDAKPPASVVYVSFGSQNSVSAPEMMDLATGLEASGKPFIWVLRPPVGLDDSTSAGEKGGGGETIIEPEWLPEGFEKRMRETNKGLLLTGWAPQVEILSHKSTGAFLSHCGWNSTVESLSCEVPMIGWPLVADQLYNSRMVAEEMGVGVEVSRGMLGGGLQGGWRAVEKAIRTVLDGGEGGGEMRRKAREMREVIALALEEKNGNRGSSITALEQFLDATAMPSVCNINGNSIS